MKDSCLVFAIFGELPSVLVCVSHSTERTLTNKDDSGIKMNHYIHYEELTRLLKRFTEKYPSISKLTSRLKAGSFGLYKSLTR